MDNVENQQEQLPEATDQDFMSGFASARGDESPEPVQALDDKAPAELPEAGGATVPDVSPEAAKVLAGLTEDQLQSILAKVPELDRKLESSIQKITGKLGEYNRTLQSLQQMQQTKAPAQQAAARKIASDMLKRTKMEFPELAEQLAEDLTEIFSTAPAAQPAFDPRAFDQVMNQRMAQMGKQYEYKLLAMRHPDWQQLTRAPEFNLWLETKPAEYKAQLMNSDDSVFVSTELDKFKAEREASTARKKTNRLAAAVAPTGTSGRSAPAQTEEDSFLAGFKQARGA